MMDLNKIEKSGVKIKIDVIRDVVVEKLVDRFRDEIKLINIEEEKTKVVNADELAMIYQELILEHPKYEKEFNDLYRRRYNEIVPNFSPYIGYTTQTTIRNKIVEYILNNENIAFDKLFEYATEGITLYNKG